MKPEHLKTSTAGRVIRTPRGYWIFIPNPLPPTIRWSSSFISAIGIAERALGKPDSLANTLPSAHIFAWPFIRREAVLSSRIEGTRDSLNDVYMHEAAQLSCLEPTTDVRGVYNYVRALDLGIERLRSLPVNLRPTCEIHAVLMEGVRGDHLTPGEFRRSQNLIGPPSRSGIN